MLSLSFIKDRFLSDYTKEVLRAAQRLHFVLYYHNFHLKSKRLRKIITYFFQEGSCTKRLPDFSKSQEPAESHFVNGRRPW